MRVCRWDECRFKASYGLLKQRSLINTLTCGSLFRVLLIFLLGVFLQKIELQVWEGLLSPQEVPFTVLLPREEAEAQSLQVFIWRKKTKTL